MSWEEDDYVLDLPERELNTEEQLRGLTPAEQTRLFSGLNPNVESVIGDMVFGLPPNRNYAPFEARPRTFNQRLENINSRRRAHQEAIAASRAQALAESLAFQRELQARLNLEREERNREAAERAEIEEAERRVANFEAQIRERPANIRNRESIRQSTNRMRARNISRQKRGKKSTYESRNYKANDPKTNKRNKKQHTKRRNRK